MDAVGADVLDDLPGLRAALGRRRRDRSGLLKLLDKLLGMDLKLRQYEQGKAFCDGVVARAGIEGLNRVWSGPRRCPRWPSCGDPAGWLRAHRAAPAAPVRLIEPAFRSAQSLGRVYGLFTCLDGHEVIQSLQDAVTRPGLRFTYICSPGKNEANTRLEPILRAGGKSHHGREHQHHHEHHHDRTSTPAASKPAAKKPAAARSRAAAQARASASRRAATRRSTTATTPSKTTGRRVRTQARNETREAAKANVRAARTTAEQGKSIAERAALSYVGATLEARDRVRRRRRHGGRHVRHAQEGRARAQEAPGALRASRHHRAQPARARRQEGPHPPRARRASQPQRRRA